MSNYPTIQKQQQGVVLVVSLMVLLVLTLLGISSLDGSIMEEKMAANSQTSNITFQAAESAIRQTFYAKMHDADGVRDPQAAKNAADNGHTENYDDASYDLTARAVMSVPLPPAGVKRPANVLCPGTDPDIATFQAIEITATADVDGINRQHTQGYNVCVMNNGT